MILLDAKLYSWSRVKFGANRVFFTVGTHDSFLFSFSITSLGAGFQYPPPMIPFHNDEDPAVCVFWGFPCYCLHFKAILEACSASDTCAANIAAGCG
jgi:hypothetical protein